MRYCKSKIGIVPILEFFFILALVLTLLDEVEDFILYSISVVYV